MTFTNVIRGTGIALLVGFGLTACANNAPQSSTNDQQAAPAADQGQQFENAKDRVRCKTKKKHHKAAPAAEKQEQQPEQQQ